MLEIGRVREATPVNPLGDDPKIDNLAALRSRGASLLNRRSAIAGFRGKRGSGRYQRTVDIVDLLEIQGEAILRIHVSERFSMEGPWESVAEATSPTIES